ncbi:hypothetical protein IAE20_12860 [Acinetobacter sp. S54]|nr:hypothetical protein [Acinetobacter sp. S55]MBK0067792.1 hypothetical protein [Acinetobacter sp. S54]
MIKTEQEHLKIQFLFIITIDYYLIIEIKDQRSHVMNATPVKHHQYSNSSIATILRQIIGWSILYTGAMILTAQAFSSLI